MITKDLIALLQRQDPEGTREVVLMDKDRGYTSVNEAWQADLVRNPAGSRTPGGDYLAADDYRSYYPHGKQRPIPALLLVAI